MGLAVLISNEKLHLYSDRRIIKAAEYASVLDARAVIDAARDEATRMARESHEILEAHCRLGYDSGVEQARAEYAQRLCELSFESAATMQLIKTTIADVVVTVVGEIAAAFGPAQFHAAVLARVEELIRDAAYVVLRVAPGAEEAVRNTLEHDWKHLQAGLKVVGDPRLEEFACVMETPAGIVEAGLEEQLAALHGAIAGWRD